MEVSDRTVDALPESADDLWGTADFAQVGDDLSVFGMCDKMRPVRGTADPDEFRAREQSPPHREVRRKPCEMTDRRSPS